MKTRVLLMFVFIFIAGFNFEAFAQEGLDSVEMDKTYMSVKSLLGQGDTYLAMEYLNSHSNPILAAQKYSYLVKVFYWKDKSIYKVVVFARAGIQYCLDQGTIADKTDKTKGDNLRNYAKAMAYDLASFTWPGWGEKELKISFADLKTGLDAAHLNLRLTKKLKKPLIQIAYAYWAMGAQSMANGKVKDGITYFTKAKENSEKAGEKYFTTYIEGCIGMAIVISGENKDAGQGRFDNAVLSLDQENQSDATFYSKQLKTAFKVFYTKSP